MGVGETWCWWRSTHSAALIHGEDASWYAGGRVVTVATNERVD